MRTDTIPPSEICLNGTTQLVCCRSLMTMAALPPLPRKHKAVAAGGLVVLVAVLVSAVYGNHGWDHLTDLEVKQRALEDIAFRLQRENAKRQEHLRMLADDDAYVTKLARERLGWIKPGETVYRVRGVTAAPRQSAPQPAAPAPAPKAALRQSRTRH